MSDDVIYLPEPTGEPEPIKWTAIYIDGVSYPLESDSAKDGEPFTVIWQSDGTVTI